MQGAFQNSLHALYGLPGGFIIEAPEVVVDGGIYVANRYDPFPRIRRKKKGKFLTTQEIEDNKWLKKKEEEEFLLLFTDEYDD